MGSLPLLQLLFSVFINDLLKGVEQAELGIQLSSGKRVGGMLLADDFVGVSDSRESLQKLIDAVHIYCSKSEHVSQWYILSPHIFVKIAPFP